MRRTLILLAPMTLVAGCALLNLDNGREQDVRSVRLPTGVSLLETDRAECPGVVQIDDDNVSRGRGADLVIQRGQNAAFEIEDDGEEIGWTCISRSRSDRDSLDCPRDTSHVRIIRESDDDLL